MKKYILIFLLLLSSVMAFAQRRGGGVIQPLPTSTLYTKVVDLHRLYFIDFFNNPVMPTISNFGNKPTMMVNDNPVPMADLNNYSLTDIDRIEYITASEMKATNDFALQSLYVASVTSDK